MTTGVVISIIILVNPTKSVPTGVSSRKSPILKSAVDVVSKAIWFGIQLAESLGSIRVVTGSSILICDFTTPGVPLLSMSPLLVFFITNFGAVNGDFLITVTCDSFMSPTGTNGGD